MSPTRRLLALVLGVAVLAAIAMVLPLGEIPDAVSRLGLLAPVAGVAVGAALLVALVPRTPISLACGVLFGAVTGTICAVILALVAATVTFVAGRWLGREFVQRRAGRRWAKLEEWISRDGVLAVAAVRALPIGPYGLSGYAYGSSSVAVRHYALGTLIAATPSAITYAILGAAVVRPGALNPLTFVPLAFGLALSAVVFVRARRRYRAATPVDRGEKR